MRRTCVYLLAIAAITATAGAAGLLPDSVAEELPISFVVDASDDAQPEHFTVAVGDAIEFQSSRGHLVIRVPGDHGILGDLSVMRVASFQAGTPYIQNGGRQVQSIRAKKSGKVTVEVTTHYGGTRREVREFNITVVDKRKEKLPVKEATPQNSYGNLYPAPLPGSS